MVMKGAVTKRKTMTAMAAQKAGSRVVLMEGVDVAGVAIVSGYTKMFVTYI
jgi:hypothetical protein